MKNLDLLKLWDKMNNIDTKLKLHRQEHKHLLYLLISIFTLSAIFLAPTILH